MEPEVTPTEVAEVPEVSTEKVAEVVIEEPVIVEQPPVQKKETAQEAIDRITRKRREAEREAEYWRNKALQPPVVEPKPVPTGRPTVSQFETTEAYEDALMQWHDSKRVAEKNLAERRRSQEQAFSRFDEKAEAERAEHDDYDDVVKAPVFTDTMKAVLLTIENGPGLAYYLGSNTKEANRIAKLPPEQQSYEIGKLETQYLIAKKTRKVPGAPDPLTPVGSTSGISKIDESKLSDDEWYRLEQQKLKEKLKKRTGG